MHGKVAVKQSSFLFKLFLCVGLFFFFVCGVAFRIYLANKLSYSYDELWAYHYANRDYSVLQHLTAPFDDRPPLHYLFLRLQSLYSSSQIWLRFPSVVMSATVLLLVFLTLKRTHPHFAIAVLLFGTISYSSIRYATLARDYAFIVMAAWLQIASVWPLIWSSKVFTSKNHAIKSGFWWMFSAFFGVALNYVYLPFLVSLYLALLVVFIWRWRQGQFKQSQVIQYAVFYMVLMGPAAMMAIYYLFGSNQLAYIQSTTQWIATPTLRDVFDLLTIHFGIGTYTNWTSLVFGSLAIVWGITKGWAQKHEQVFIVFVFTTMFINIVGLTAYSLLGTSVFLLRYFAPLSVLSLLFVSYLGWRIWESAEKVMRTVMLVWFVFGFTPYMLTEINNRLGFYGKLESYGTEGTRLIETVKQEWRPGDQLVFSPKSYGILYRDFYFNDEKYFGNDEIAQQLEPVDIFQCEKRKRLTFIEDAKLIMAVVSETAYGQPESILISETTSEIYPKHEVPLHELCADMPRSIFKSNQTAVVTCKLKPEVRLTQYCYLHN